MYLKAALPLGLLFTAGALIWISVPWADLGQWTAAMQREFQNAMARALRALQTGDGAAIWALCGTTAAYGFVHAVGPGHGKVVLGGAALASGATLSRMAALTVAASLGQSLVAILLVGLLAIVPRAGSRSIEHIAEDWLAPASYVAFAMIGAVLFLRGLSAWSGTPRKTLEGEKPHSKCGCGHAHGPTVAEIEDLTTGRDAIALVASIAMRPCTGALFLLVIAWRFDIFWHGCLAVLTMGLGTAAFNLMVASSGVAARRVAVIGSLGGTQMRLVSSVLYLTGGALVFAVSLSFLSRVMG